MQMPQLDPDVADVAPMDSVLVTYDADGADWRQVSRLSRIAMQDSLVANELLTCRPQRALVGRSKCFPNIASFRPLMPNARSGFPKKTRSISCRKGKESHRETGDFGIGIAHGRCDMSCGYS